MKIFTPELAWHYELESTSSIDFHPKSQLLAVAGSDSTGQNIYLRVWEICCEKLKSMKENQEFKNDQVIQDIFKLVSEISSGHQKTINCVRFSPSGINICTGADDSKVIVWAKRMRPKEFGSLEEIEGWAESRVLTGHGGEVYDVRWFSDEKMIVSASLDYSLIIWDAENGNMKQKLEGHSNYVKGIAIDPLGTHIMSQSTDRSIRIYKKAQNSNTFICKSV